MAENKKSFILYADIISMVDRLSNEQSGILFKLILDYVNDKNPNIEEYDQLIQIAFEPIKTQLKRDLKHWEHIKEVRSNNGKKGGRPSKIKGSKAKKANGFSEKLNKAKKAVNDNVNVNVNVNVINDNIDSVLFYLDQLIQCENENRYLTFVNFIFGNNKTKEALTGVLSIPKQLSFESFIGLLAKKPKGFKILDAIEQIENTPKYYKGKKDLNLILHNWINRTINN